MSFKTRLFTILFAAGLAGVFSVLLFDLPALVAILHLPEGTEIPPITPAIKLLSLIQQAILLSLAVLVGVALAPKVGLSSPAAEHWGDVLAVSTDIGEKLTDAMRAVSNADEELLVYQHGTDPLTARWWVGLGEDERRQARAEAQRYEGLGEEERDRLWGEVEEAIEDDAEGAEE